jgi:hypothetical protein
MFKYDLESGKLQNQALDKLREKAEQKVQEKAEEKDRSDKAKHFAKILEWAVTKAWGADSEGRLPGCFLRVSDGEPAYKKPLEVYVSPGSQPGEFETQNGGPWTRDDGWIVFMGPAEFTVWIVGDPEPDIVAECRRRKAEEKELKSNPKLLQYLSNLFGQASGEAAGVINAAQVLKIIAASSFAEKDEASRLFSVSIALHLHGAEIFEMGMAFGGCDALVIAFEEALGYRGGRVAWLDGPGRVALEAKDQGGFVTWSKQLWSIMEKISPADVNEAVVEKVFNHNKGYQRSVPLAEELRLDRTGSDEALVKRLRSGLTEYSEAIKPLGNVVTAFLQMAMIGTGTSYGEFADLYRKHELSIKKVYPDGVDIESEKAKRKLADNFGIK